MFTNTHKHTHGLSQTPDTQTLCPTHTHTHRHAWRLVFVCVAKQCIAVPWLVIESASTPPNTYILLVDSQLGTTLIGRLSGGVGPRFGLVCSNMKVKLILSVGENTELHIFSSTSNISLSMHLHSHTHTHTNSHTHVQKHTHQHLKTTQTCW